MCESFGTGITQVIGNVKHPCSVCLKGVGVNSIRCTQCVQWVHARCSRVKGSLKKVESSFICRRCKGELCETKQVNGLHIDGHEYEIVDKLCFFRWHVEPGRWLWACHTKKDTHRLVGVQGDFRSAYRKRDESEVKRNYLYNMHKTWNVVWQWDMATKVEDIRKIQRSEMRMLRWMTGVSLSERKSNECVRSMLAIDDIAEVIQRNRLRWFGHVERRDELCWIKRIWDTAGRWWWSER